MRVKIIKHGNQLGDQRTVGYLKVNALGDSIIRIYLPKFTNNEREISMLHKAAELNYYTNLIPEILLTNLNFLKNVPEKTTLDWG